MPPKSIPPPEVFLDANFPKAGIDLSAGFDRQPVRPDGKGGYVKTCFDATNVRAKEPLTRRERGGQRAGLKKFRATQVQGSEFVVQELCPMVLVGVNPPGGGSLPQLSQSGRLVLLVAVSGGEVYTTPVGGTVWTHANNATGETPPLAASGLVFSAPNQQKLWFADGTNYAYYDPVDDTVHLWAATSGILPSDAANNTPRLVCTWRGRTVLSGLLKDPHNWFMSAVDDPTDFDYSPAPTSQTQAVAGNNAPAGLIGDVVTTLIPYSDDILIFGGDSSIYAMRGDPAAGGTIDRVSDSIGMAWGLPWCRDPYGTIYFFSNRTGIYTLVPGRQPTRISQAIDQLIQDTNTGEYAVRMAWDDRFEGLHVFVTALAEPTPTYHLFYEASVGAWWRDKFARPDFDPLTCCVLDGNEPTDRVVVIGSWDGWVRYFDPEVFQDDLKPIESEVWIGPVATKNMGEVLLRELQCVLGDDSGDVKFFVHVGETAQSALASEPVTDGTWEAGRNFTENIRSSGFAVYVRLTATNPWQFESMRAAVTDTGRVRRRGRR